MTPDALTASVCSAISEVLFVPTHDIHPDQELIADLGAESIDFLDLIYRLEDIVGAKVTVTRFDEWVQERLARDGVRALTVQMVIDFTNEEASTTKERGA